MKKRLLVLATALLLAVSGGVVAESPHDGAQCQSIHGRVVLVSFEVDCAFEGEDYMWCFGYEMKGKYKGTWLTGIKPGWADRFLNQAVLLDDTVLTTIDGSENLWYRENEVLELQRGKLFASAQYIVDTRLWDIGGTVPIAGVFTGGTGIYQDASGWFLQKSQDFFTTADFTGEVCGPNIPGQKVDDE